MFIPAKDELSKSKAERSEGKKNVQERQVQEGGTLEQVEKEGLTLPLLVHLSSYCLFIDLFMTERVSLYVGSLSRCLQQLGD